MTNLADLLRLDIPLPPHRLSGAALDRLNRYLRLGHLALLPAGERVGGRFEVRELIGVGSHGLVYRAADRTARDAVVAVKVLHPGVDEASRHRLIAEARMLAAHRHPHVVGLHDAGLHDGLLFLAMEHLPLTLRDHLARGAVTVAEAMRLFHHVGDALRFLHGRGVVHRNLKPGNVLLDATPARLEPRVTDAGQSGGVGEMDTAGLFASPPEQVRDPTPEISHDIYALGALLFELLAGAHPTATPAALQALSERIAAGEPTSEAYAAVLQRSRRRSLPLGPGIRDVAELEAIIARAMHLEPAARYPSVVALQEDLRRYAELRPLLGIEQSLEQRVSKVLRRNRVRAVVIGAVSLLGGMAGGALAWRQTQPGVVVPVQHQSIPGLEVTVGGETFGIDELVDKPLGPGLVSLHLSAPGHHPADRLVHVPAAGHLELWVDLVRHTGEVVFQTDPRGAQVTLVGDRSVLPPMVAPFRHTLPTGRWTATIEAEAHQTATEVFVVSHDGLTEVQGTLEPLFKARRALGMGGRVSLRPERDGSVPLLATTSVVEGEPFLELRQAASGALVESSLLPAATASAVRWVDVDLDGEAEAVYADVRRALVVWGRDGVRWEQPTGSVVRTPPVVAAGLLVYTAADGVLRARRPVDGSLAWETRLSEATGHSAVPDGPIGVHRGMVYVRSVDGSLHAVNASTGVAAPLPGLSEGSWPVATVLVLEHGGVVVAAVDDRGWLSVVDAGTGELLRHSGGESPDLQGSLPIWREGGRWMRLRVDADATVHTEDLLHGEVLRTLGSFPRVERAWVVYAGVDQLVALLAGDDVVYGVRFGAGEVDVLFRRQVGRVSDPVFYREPSTGRLLGAWCEAASLVVAPLSE